MPLPLTVSCFSKIQIGFTFLVPAHLVVPEKGPLNGCIYLSIYLSMPNSGLCLKLKLKTILLAELCAEMH